MFPFRNILLLLAPIPVITGSMSLAKWAHEDPYRFATRNEVTTSAQSQTQIPAARPWVRDQSEDLKRRTEAVANSVARRLSEGDAVIIRTPLVIGGNLAPHELEKWHRTTILPAIDSIRSDYIQTDIPDPISILIFKDEASYRETAKRLFAQNRVSIYGFYLPYCRTVLINLSAGGGTLVHELTHALLDFDFPDAPIWFNEGLGSLHEQCRFDVSDGHPTIVPENNWRLEILQNAMMQGRMEPLWEFVKRTDFQGRDQALLYAHARYFCFYLHEQQKLSEFYSLFRDEVAENPNGDVVIRRMFPTRTWPQIERDFRGWVLTQSALPTVPPTALPDAAPTQRPDVILAVDEESPE